MPGISYKTDTSAFTKRLGDYISRLHESLGAALPEIALEMAEEVKTSTPSKETEYDYLMTGGSSQADLVPLSGDQSADDDPPYKSGAKRNRIRFIRNPGNWLEDLVVTPGVGFIADPDALFIGLGVISELEIQSRFSWQNSSKSGDTLHTSDYGVWSFFEYGYENAVTPNGDYRLTPDSTHRLKSMSKNYPAFRFYAGFSTTTFIETVKARIMDVKF